ncbi:MAG: hypothetical protein WDZ28_02745 [Simkaniaceae bacterium]
MRYHKFLFSEGSWLGEGKIRLNLSEDELDFYMRWSVEDYNDIGPVRCVQEIQVQGLQEVMYNSFSIAYDLGGDLSIELDNQTIGTILGQGFVSPFKIAWEFNEKGFKGFEFYQKLRDREYQLHAEYGADDFRTVIEGKIWQKEE